MTEPACDGACAECKETDACACDTPHPRIDGIIVALYIQCSERAAMRAHRGQWVRVTYRAHPSGALIDMPIAGPFGLARSAMRWAQEYATETSGQHLEPAYRACTCLSQERTIPTTHAYLEALPTETLTLT